MPSRVQWQGIEPSEAERGLQYQYSLLCLVPASYQNKLQNPAQVNSSQEKREQSHGERRDASSEQTSYHLKNAKFWFMFKVNLGAGILGLKNSPSLKNLSAC